MTLTIHSLVGAAAYEAGVSPKSFAFATVASGWSALLDDPAEIHIGKVINYLQDRGFCSFTGTDQAARPAFVGAQYAFEEALREGLRKDFLSSVWHYTHVRQPPTPWCLPEHVTRANVDTQLVKTEIVADKACFGTVRARAAGMRELARQPRATLYTVLSQGFDMGQFAIGFPQAHAQFEASQREFPSNLIVTRAPGDITPEQVGATCWFKHRDGRTGFWSFRSKQIGHEGTKWEMWLVDSIEEATSGPSIRPDVLAREQEQRAFLVPDLS